jgi:hypothetical protein
MISCELLCRMNAPSSAENGGESSIRSSSNGFPATAVGAERGFDVPERIAGAELRILYLDGVFACRKCLKLAYSSQWRPAWRRALYRAQDIRERLGGTPNMFDPFPCKPKGMHWRTYWELRRLHDEANAHSWPGWLQRWMPSCVTTIRQLATKKRE